MAVVSADIATEVAANRIAQGLPSQVTDPSTLDQLAKAMRPWLLERTAKRESARREIEAA